MAMRKRPCRPRARDLHLQRESLVRAIAQWVETKRDPSLYQDVVEPVSVGHATADQYEKVPK